MSKAMQRDLDRAVKAMNDWIAMPYSSRLNFHEQRAEQKMLELCLNFVSEHHKKLTTLIAKKDSSP